MANIEQRLGLELDERYFALLRQDFALGKTTMEPFQKNFYAAVRVMLLGMCGLQFLLAGLSFASNFYPPLLGWLFRGIS